MMELKKIREKNGGRMFVVYSWIVLGVALFFLVFGLLNELAIKFHSKIDFEESGKKVSILIPARNEEKNIRNCIWPLVRQLYDNYEVVVLDDNSTDATWSILEELQKEYPKILRIYKGEKLPEGWKGKNFAMEQLYKKAQGEILICTDADTVHKRTMLSFAVHNFEKNKADYLSGYVLQEMKTFGEKITIPLMYMLTSLIIPSFLNTLLPYSFLSIGIGQFIMIKKSVLEQIGGYAAIKDRISDDVYLSRLVKKCGFKSVFINLQEEVSCRMYNSYKSASRGIVKNIADFFNGFSIIPLIIAFFIFLVLPFFIGMYELLVLKTLSLIGLSVIVFFVIWVQITVCRELPWYTPFLYPIIFLNLLYMATLSQINAIRGTSYTWKGRKL
ncbi:MAG: glycosyltransferase [Spirochaetaceae bacterium]|nr:glycosyltransferase [Spirochaetaceae bacterium]